MKLILKKKLERYEYKITPRGLPSFVVIIIIVDAVDVVAEGTALRCSAVNDDL